MPRMADFVKWVSAAETLGGNPLEDGTRILEAAGPAPLARRSDLR
jgi:hypothetical protein